MRPKFTMEEVLDGEPFGFAEREMPGFIQYWVVMDSERSQPDNWETGSLFGMEATLTNDQKIDCFISAETLKYVLEKNISLLNLFDFTIGDKEVYLRFNSLAVWGEAAYISVGDELWITSLEDGYPRFAGSLKQAENKNGQKLFLKTGHRITPNALKILTKFKLLDAVTVDCKAPSFIANKRA